MVATVVDAVLEPDATEKQVYFHAGGLLCGDTRVQPFLPLVACQRAGSNVVFAHVFVLMAEPPWQPNEQTDKT